MRRARQRRSHCTACGAACASFLLAQKLDARLLMEILGHAEINTTLALYGHVMPTAKKDAATVKGAAFGVAGKIVRITERQAV
jgi:integrase